MACLKYIVSDRFTGKIIMTLGLMQSKILMIDSITTQEFPGHGRVDILV